MSRKGTQNFDPANVKPCAGTCGRDTRPSTWRAVDVPPELRHAVIRAGADMCGRCYKNSPEYANRASRPVVEVELTDRDLHNIRVAQRYAREREARLGGTTRRRTPALAGRGTV